MNPITKALNWRYATKQYDASKKLSADQLAVITDALRLAPSSFGLQAYKFIHVTDAALREKLKAVGYGQSQITDASDFFVLASYTSIDEAYIDSYLAVIAKARGISVDALKGFRDMLVGAVKGRTPRELEEWLARQVYVPLGVALTAAAANGIDASPMEGFDPKQFDEILGLAKEKLASRVLLAVGFRSRADSMSPDKTAKARFPKEVLFIER